MFDKSIIKSFFAFVSSLKKIIKHNNWYMQIINGNNILSFFDFINLKSLFFIFYFFNFQNLLFYYDNEASTRPSGLIFLEGCYCERLISAPSCLGSASGTSGGQGSKNHKEEKLQVSFSYNS